MVDFSGDQEQLHYYQLGGGEEEPLNTWGRGGEGKEGGKRERGRERRKGEERGRRVKSR